MFAKAPIAGQVKTRLCPPLTPDEAASLHGSLVMDLVERFKALKGFDGILAGTPSANHPFFLALQARFHVKVWDQEGNDLGERMDKVFQKALQSSYRSAVIIGSDIPGITATLVNEARQGLDDHDVVLGPTLDGGYYLIGLREPFPELFADMRWSTNEVFEESEKRVAAAGKKLKVLPTLRDVDTGEDLDSFIQESQNPQCTIFSARTRNVLKELAKRLSHRQ